MTPTAIYYRHVGVPTALRCGSEECGELATHQSPSGSHVRCDNCQSRSGASARPLDAETVRGFLRDAFADRNRKDCWLLLGWLRGEAL